MNEMNENEMKYDEETTTTKWKPWVMRKPVIIPKQEPEVCDLKETNNH
jgi:hypothetical protein